jgi:hypothetical protein
VPDCAGSNGNIALVHGSAREGRDHSGGIESHDHCVDPFVLGGLRFHAQRGMNGFNGSPEHFQVADWRDGEGQQGTERGSEKARRW